MRRSLTFEIYAGPPQLKFKPSILDQLLNFNLFFLQVERERRRREKEAQEAQVQAQALGGVGC